MTLAAQTPIDAYVGNGSVNSYPFTFPVFNQNQILVTVVSPTPNFTIYNLILGTDYTVAGISPDGNPASTGSILLVSNGQAWLTAGNLTNLWTLVIQRSTPIAQTFSIRNQGDYYRGFLENALDTDVMIEQELEEQIASKVGLPTGILPSAFSPVLPQNIEAGAGLSLVINSTGNGFTLGAATGGVSVPVPISQGGTNSTTALANNRVIVSKAGQIVEDSALAANSVVYTDSNGLPTTTVPVTNPLVPIGTIFDYAGTSLPTGWLNCDGGPVSRTTYANLFAALGTTWGVGDGATTFNTPDLRRFTTVGAGGVGTGTLGNAVGNIGGQETHTLIVSEIPANLTVTDAGHLHGILAQAGTAGAGGSSVIAPNGSVALNTQTAVTGISVGGGGGAHNNIQPSAIVKKIIKF